MATTEPAAPLPETAADPQGTPPAATPAPAEATPPSPAPTVDWENRYNAAETQRKAAQAELTRQQMARAEAERQRDALRQQQSEPDDDAEGPTAARPPRRNSAEGMDWEKRALTAEWQIARSVFGEEVVSAYGTAQDLLKSASTPADYVNAFEVYHQARSKGMTHQEAVAEVSPAPVAPVVDSNRSDGPLLTDVDQQLREAAAKKDLQGWVAAKLRGAKG